MYTNLDSTPPAIVDQAMSALKSPHLAEVIAEDYAALGVAGEGDLTFALYLVGVSRLLEKPLAAIVQGSSSSGKSFLVEKTEVLFPREAKLVATNITANALYHLPPGSLEHRLVIVGERSRIQNNQTAEATRALREMLSSGSLTKLVPEKSKTGQRTALKEQQGPIAYLESTTLREIFEEDLNRCLLFKTNESKDQTERILNKTAAFYAGDPTPDIQSAIHRHHTIQRLLQKRPVAIPYAPQLARKISPDHVDSRRDFPKLLHLIQASCLLNQFQRPQDKHGRLTATEKDLHTATQLYALHANHRTAPGETLF